MTYTHNHDNYIQVLLCPSIYRLKKDKTSKESSRHQVIDLKSIQGTLTLPEKNFLDRLKKCSYMFPNLYSKDSTLPVSLRTLEDEVPASFDSDQYHQPLSQSKLKRHHS